MCQKKHKFNSKIEADRYITALKTLGVAVSVQSSYFCNECKMWCLTSKLVQ